MQQVALILRLMTSWNFTEEELALLRSMPKHEAGPHEPWLAKPPIRPRHVQRKMVFRGEWTPEFGDAEFLVYIRMGLIVEGDFSCGIAYRVTSEESLMLARYCGWRHSHREIIRSPHIHWLTSRALAAGTPVEIEAMASDRFDSLESAVLCLIEDFNLSEIHFPDRLRRMFDGTRF